MIYKTVVSSLGEEQKVILSRDLENARGALKKFVIDESKRIISELHLVTHEKVPVRVGKKTIFVEEKEFELVTGDNYYSLMINQELIVGGVIIGNDDENFNSLKSTEIFDEIDS